MTRAEKWVLVAAAAVAVLMVAGFAAGRRVRVEVPQEGVVVDPPEVHKVVPAQIPPSEAGMEEKG